MNINTSGAYGQSDQIGIIDFYGTISNESELRKCLPFIENDTITFLNEAAYPKVYKSIVDCLLSQSNIKQAAVEFVCCDNKEGKWIVFVGVDTKSKEVSKSKKNRDIELPGKIKDSYDSLMNLVMVAVQKGEATEDNSKGHSLMIYPPARNIQEHFITYANKNLAQLKDVLKNSQYVEQREVAATVIAYYKDKREIIQDLLGAVSDSAQSVRNNAVRAIGIIANYAQSHPPLKIKVPAEPFIGMMNSNTWTDRNKSSFVLMSLTDNRDKKTLNQVREHALQPIIDMAKWKSNGHSMPGLMLLGRIAGWTDKQIHDGTNSSRQEVIEKMLTKINN